MLQRLAGWLRPGGLLRLVTYPAASRHWLRATARWLRLGGIGPETIGGAASAGANFLVAGSALYRDPEGLAHAVADLRARATAAIG